MVYKTCFGLIQFNSHEANRKQNQLVVLKTSKKVDFNSIIGCFSSNFNFFIGLDLSTPTQNPYYTQVRTLSNIKNMQNPLHFC
jgi:hypothetical protein